MALRLLIWAAFVSSEVSLRQNYRSLTPDNIKRHSNVISHRLQQRQFLECVHTWVKSL